MNTKGAAADLRRMVEDLNQQMVGCLLRGDLAGYASFYSDDATIIGFDKRKAQGREAVNAFCSGMTGVKEAWVKVLDVGASGDLIYQVATSFSRWEKADGERGSYQCDCMYVWRREGDTFRIFLDAYN